jgi:hypothetical protein
VADEVHAVAGQNAMLGRLEVGEVRRARNHPAGLVHIAADEHRHDARNRLRSTNIDGCDPRVGVGTAHERGVQHPGDPEVVDISRASGDQARILDPLDRTADVWSLVVSHNGAPTY